MSVALKPCPYCGGVAEVGETKYGCVVCQNDDCNAVGPNFDHDGAKWNAISRTGAMAFAMSDGELLARSQLAIGDEGSAAPCDSTMSEVDVRNWHTENCKQVRDELDRRAAARKAATS